MSTLQAAAAVVTSTGFSHFELSRDTRLTMEARKAHSFVSVNCETMARKILTMSGVHPGQVEEILKGIMKQTHAFRHKKIKDADAHAATQPGPDGTGTA